MVSFITTLALYIFCATVNSQAPLFLALLLIFYAATQAGLAWTIASKWLSLAIFLVFIGGMMVVFLYVTSLVTNPSATTLFTGSVLSFGVLWIGVKGWALSCQPFMQMNISQQLYLMNTQKLVCLLLLYLLLTLVLVVKLVESFKGALITKF